MLKICKYVVLDEKATYPSIRDGVLYFRSISEQAEEILKVLEEFVVEDPDIRMPWLLDIRILPMIYWTSLIGIRPAYNDILKTDIVVSNGLPALRTKIFLNRKLVMCDDIIDTRYVALCAKALDGYATMSQPLDVLDDLKAAAELSKDGEVVLTLPVTCDETVRRAYPEKLKGERVPIKEMKFDDGYGAYGENAELLRLTPSMGRQHRKAETYVSYIPEGVSRTLEEGLTLQPYDRVVHFYAYLGLKNARCFADLSNVFFEFK